MSALMLNNKGLLSVILTCLALLVTSCGASQAEQPTKDIVERALKPIWEHPASSTAPRSTLIVSSVKFGKPNTATAQEVQVEGLPEGAVVTPAIIDFTVKTFYDGETQSLRRVREARVYKDKFDEWAVMTGSVRGEDERTTEPVAK